MAKKREINSNKMVTLPLLNALTAVVLAEQLITIALQQALPLLVERALLRLKAAVEALKAQMQPREEADSKEKRLADRALDNAWRSLHQWLGALILMPSSSLPARDQLQALYDLLFYDGMLFINVSYREQWTETETRLKAIADGGYETVIAENGGAPLLAHLEDAQVKYGKVLGIRAPLDVKKSPAIRENYRVLLDAIRSYVVKAVAWADPEEPGSEALSESLIQPVVNWQDPRTKSDDDDATQEIVEDAAAV
jgi:hypothetical protein